jgi:hypothetical protein
MAWQEVQTDVGPKVGRVRYSVAHKHGGARISVPKHVVQELGWKTTTTFRLLVGGGDLAGKLRIEPADKGRITGKTGGGPGAKSDTTIIRLGRWEKLAPRDVKGVAVEHEVDKQALVIILPRHAQMATPEPRPQAAPAKPTPPTAAKRDVTSQFFNDPKKPVGMQSGTRGGR